MLTNSKAQSPTPQIGHQVHNIIFSNYRCWLGKWIALYPHLWHVKFNLFPDTS